MSNTNLKTCTSTAIAVLLSAINADLSIPSQGTVDLWGELLSQEIDISETATGDVPPLAGSVIVAVLGVLIDR